VCCERRYNRLAVALRDAESVGETSLSGDDLECEDVAPMIAGQLTEESDNVLPIYLAWPREPIPDGRWLDASVRQSQTTCRCARTE
jgi:hypothetical protein